MERVKRKPTSKMRREEEEEKQVLKRVITMNVRKMNVRIFCLVNGTVQMGCS